MCEILIAATTCSERELRDAVGLAYRVSDWQKMLCYLQDNDGQSNHDNGSFIPPYPLVAIIEGEIQYASPARTQRILMCRADAEDVQSIASSLCLTEICSVSEKHLA